MSISYISISILALFNKDILAKIKSSYSVKAIVSYNIFYLCFIIGCLWHTSSYLESLGMLRKIIFFAIAPILYAALSVDHCPKWLFRGFLAAATLNVVLAISAFIFNTPILQGIVEARDGGSKWVIFHGHLLQNSFLAIASILVLNLLLDKNIYKTKPLIVFYSLLYGLIFIDIFYLVVGRTGWVMFIIMHLVLLLFRFKLKGLVIGLMLGVISCSLLYQYTPNFKAGINDYIHNQQQYIAGNYHTSVGLRENFHANSIAIIKSKPWLGYGTGSFINTYTNYAKLHKQFITHNPHGDWYLIGVELGIFGIAAFILMLLANLYSFYRLNNMFYKILGLCLFSAYVVASSENLFFLDNVSGVTYIVLALTIIAANAQNNFLSPSDDAQ